MKIDSIMQNINISVKGQIENAANNGSANNRTADNKASSVVSRSVNPSLKEGLKDKQQITDKQIKPVESGLFDLKAVFAVDKEKNVVIRFMDQKGEVVKQVPPEEYMNMIKKFKDNVENLFSKEV